MAPTDFVATKISGYGSDVLTVTQMPSIIQTAEEYLQDQKRKNIEFTTTTSTSRKPAPAACQWARRFRLPATVVNGKQSTNNTTINGWTSSHGRDRATSKWWRAAQLTPIDDKLGTHDIVVGYDIVDNLLPNGDPIGQEIRVDGEVYTIVGVANARERRCGQSDDNYVEHAAQHLPAHPRRAPEREHFRQGRNRSWRAGQHHRRSPRAHAHPPPRPARRRRQLRHPDQRHLHQPLETAHRARSPSSSSASPPSRWSSAASSS